MNIRRLRLLLLQQALVLESGPVLSSCHGFILQNRASENTLSKDMAVQEFIPIPVASALLGAIAGGFVVHLLTAHRDRLNNKRAKKTDFLIQAYRRLESCAHSEPSKNREIPENELS